MIADTYQETSREAWQEFAPVSGKLDDQILGALKEAGAYGLICEEIEQQIARSHQAVSGNLRHLVERGRVEPTGLKGRTSSGRSALKWRLVEAA